MGSSIDIKEIPHEIIHFLKLDIVRRLLSLNQSQLLRLNRFQEKRADILGALCSLSVLQNDINFYRKRCTCCFRGRYSMRTHPFCSQRFTYLSELKMEIMMHLSPGKMSPALISCAVSQCKRSMSPKSKNEKITLAAKQRMKRAGLGKRAAFEEYD